MTRRISITALLAAVALTIAACSSDEPLAPDTSSSTTTTAAVEPVSVLDLAVEAGQFSTLIAAVEAAGLGGTLESEGPFTVLAPTDEAFATALDTLGLTAEQLLADTDTLSAILTYHVLPQAADSKLVSSLDGQSVPTVNGQAVSISVTDGQIQIDDATVVSADLEADNGIVHVINGVLLPPDIAGAGGDAASEEVTTTTTEASTDATIAGIVADLAVGDPAEFTILLEAVQSADPAVAALLSDPEASVTVFAPTDAAFVQALEALGLSADDLLGSTDLLTSILLYHVADGVLLAGDITDRDGQTIATLNPDETLSITVSSDGAVLLNDGVAPLGGSAVVQTDVMATNGVVHVVDAVLINDSILGA